MHMSILPVWKCVYHMHAWYSWRKERSIGSTGTGVKDNCEPSCVCWELNWTELGLSGRTACAEPSILCLVPHWNCKVIVQEWGLEDDGRIRDCLETSPREEGRTAGLTEQERVHLKLKGTNEYAKWRRVWSLYRCVCSCWPYRQPFCVQSGLMGHTHVFFFLSSNLSSPNYKERPGEMAQWLRHWLFFQWSRVQVSAAR